MVNGSRDDGRRERGGRKRKREVFSEKICEAEGRTCCNGNQRKWGGESPDAAQMQVLTETDEDEAAR